DLTVGRQQVEDLAFPLFACGLYVFVNGREDESLSVPHALSGELSVASLARLRREGGDGLGALGVEIDLKAAPFAALNTAFVDDGAVIRVPRGWSAEHPLHLVFLTGGGRMVTHPRVLVVAEAGSRATVIQDFLSVDASETWTNAVTEVVAEPGAHLDLVSLQRENDQSLHTSTTAVRQQRDSRVSVHTLTLGGRLVRNDLQVVLAEPGAESHMRGLFLGTGDRLVDNHTGVDHAVPHGTSHELYKGILADRSRGVFRGRIVVRPDAQKTDATQSNPNLLMDAGAEIDTKPQLEIYADDVKCSHGSAIGRIDPDALFYLQARGIGESEARELLMRGFANEITQALPVEALGERVNEILMEKLRARPAEESA
ncbi:MAG: Fe-S cluster assembly protein SufD, partial [Proteobacteria bacterium]|nr:Fe-S cluster assembly protein SufD [Pseudomonadota bacterium]